MPIWIFIITPYLEAMPTNYYRYEEQDGLNSLSPNFGAPLSKSFKHHNTQEIKVLNVVGNNLKITSRLQAVNVDTGKKFLDETRLYDVDRFSRTHQSLEQGYFLFPPNTQQHDYFLTFPIGFTHAVYKFEGTDVIHGLDVDVFTCISDPYDITNAIPQFKDYKVKSVYSCKVLVEPVTGQDVDYQLSWESHFYFQNGTIASLAEKGNKETTPEYVSKFIELAKNTKTLFQIYNQAVPYSLLGSGGIILTVMRVSNRTNKTEDRSQALLHNVHSLEEVAKATTNEIMKSAKLITLGQLSANLSHDIRNGLQTLITAVRLIEERNKDITEDDKVDLKQIRSIAERLHRQITDVMTFVRTTPLNIQEISLNDIIDPILEKISLPTNIQVIKPKNNIKIFCDRIKMESVIFNLIINAIDAIGDKGKITISAKNTLRHSIILIQDTGNGILENNLYKIFDPLFTTKSSGTGLGLAICKNIVNEHNGFIEVQNNPTTFIITIPKS